LLESKNRVSRNLIKKGKQATSARAYILIDAAEGKGDEIQVALWGKPGITLLECVEGPPDIIMVGEADDRQNLARMVIQALNSVERLTDSVTCLPVSDGMATWSQRSNTNMTSKGRRVQSMGSTAGRQTERSQ